MNKNRVAVEVLYGKLPENDTSIIPANNALVFKHTNK